MVSSMFCEILRKGTSKNYGNNHKNPAYLNLQLENSMSLYQLIKAYFLFFQEK